LLRQIFGWGSFFVIFAIAGAGILLLVGKMPDRNRIPWHIVIGGEVVFLSLLSLVQLFVASDAPWKAAQAGNGGGYVGAVFASILSELLGVWPAVIVLAIVLIGGLITIAGMSVQEFLEWLEDGMLRIREKVGVALVGLGTLSTPVEDNMPVEPELFIPQSPPLTLPSPPARQDLPPVQSVPKSKPKRSRQYKVALPPLTLLEEPAAAILDQETTQQKARVIEETLAQFDVPTKVIETNWGPRVTQFGVEPGYVTRRGYGGEETERKVRVAKIASLNRDLALALAASPIRIEAPVPGRSIVGIEVPNSQVALVSLRKGMSSAKFRRRKSDLTLVLGEGVAGTPIIADLAKMPHLLIAGATGSGKSICINAIASCLLLQNSPLTLRLVMVDPKRVEMVHYNALPHLYGHVECDVERVVGVLSWLVNEMQERYKKFAELGVRHLDDYNRRWQVGSSEYMPRIVVLIDELADLMLFSPDEVERAICRLAQMARATGMHLVIATQRPSVDVVTGLIKANFPARIAFAVSSGVDSRVILDAIGAETLLSKGDMLYMSPDSSKIVRTQGCFVSDAEVERVVQYWQEWAADEEWEKEPPPWDSHLAEQDALAGDDLLRKAIEIVRQQGSASASMLQRRMRIGHPRAARLIDELEGLGIVGPAESGGRPRQVIELSQGYEAGTLVSEGETK
jgi:S-DNA-T family DNA segregation ATPase FtsK/SpoIIIE